MARSITGKTISGETVDCEYSRNPDICPICYSRVTTRAIFATVTETSFFKELLQIVFRCPNHDCDRLFIGLYERSTNRTGGMYSPVFTLTDLAPVFPPEEPFSDEIKSISPSLIEIYNQAAVAEGYGLKQVAGMGFRKALEFLIKDISFTQGHLTRKA